MREQAKWGKGALRVVVVVVLALGIGSAPARAQVSFGVSAGLFQPAEKETDRTEVYGLRAGYRFNPSIGCAAVVTREDLADTLPPNDASDSGDPSFNFDFKFQVIHLDLSVEWFPRGGHFVVFGGGGMSRLEARLSGSFFGQTFSEIDTSNIFTLHAGVGYEWGLGGHFFIRPEARYRYLFDDDQLDQGEGFRVIYDASGPEATVVLGYRLGS